MFGKWRGVDAETLPSYLHLIGGANAGAIAAAVTCPLDVVKTRIQVQHTEGGHQYNTVLNTVRKMLQEEGLSAFGKGFFARIVWIAPGTAITIAAYEKFKSLLSLYDN